MPAGPDILLTLARWFSPAWPTGGFAWSHGLETLVAEGRVTTADDVAGWLDDVLGHGAGRNDAILLAAAWRAETPDDRRDLADLALALAAGAERARETAEQGAAFARTAQAVDGAGDGRAAPLPVAVGAAARAHGLPLPETLTFYLQSLASALVSIAVRHVPLGQTEGQTILAACAPLIRRIVDEALTSTPDDLGGCAFAADLAALRHETLPVRIFRS